MKAPAFQFYPKDFLTDERVGLMSYTERGIYITLLSKCWLEGSLPASVEDLARLLGLPVQRFRRLWVNSLSCCFITAGDGRITQKRLEEEREKQEQYRRRQSDKGTKGADKRWPKDGTSIAPAMAQAIPDDSSSISDLRTPVKTNTLMRGVPKRDEALTDEIAERAGRFVDRYDALYQVHRKGARLLRRQPNLDWDRACRLCRLWADDRLEKMAVIFLKSNEDWISSTDRGLAVFEAKASWCDDRLAEWEAKQRKPA